jgi:hypothetical protein
MKKKTINIESISLDKETIARLDEAQLSGAFGGARGGDTYSCNAPAALEDELELDTCCKGSCGTTGCQ